MSSTADHLRTAARRRRLALAGINVLLLALGGTVMAGHLSEGGWTAIELVLLGLFVVLLVPVVYGFTVAVTGWWVLRSGGDPLWINHALPPEFEPADLPAVAIVVPIYNEDVSRVFQGLRAMYESLQRTGKGATFDFFVLSDSSDFNLWVAEEQAWFDLCKRVQGFGRVFYRKRRHPLHHKSGNVADFCRRWAARYRYMVVLDADSLMTGPAFLRLAALMEQNPRVGIIQTCPRLAFGRSLFQRINQFANSVYGPVFNAGAGFWQLDTANFWGHNAIIRLKPFTRHCALPELPGSSRLGAHVLSHDMVEAAFMRRAGYEVWTACDLESSYEESPPHLLASLQRDRRWCHGNLQHMWFLPVPGLKACSRLNLLLGIMAYAASPLWLLFLLLTCVLSAIGPAAGTPTIGNLGGGLLFVAIMALLLTPKALGAMLLARDPEKLAACGGAFRLVLNVIGETVYSLVLAPILMLFHTRFVWASLAGATVGWGRQSRADDAGPSWRDLASAHAGQTVLVLGWAGLVAWLAPALLPWLALVLLGPILALPFSRFTASTMLGALSRKTRWFLVPEETRPPVEFQEMASPAALSAEEFIPDKAYAGDRGLLQAVIDPYVNALHVSLLRQRPQTPGRTREFPAVLADRLLLDGPFALTPREKRMLLHDPDAMLAAHQKLWSSTLSHVHDWWQAAFRHYNESHARDFWRRLGAR